MRGTLLRHPNNGTLVFSPYVWNDPNYAITTDRGQFGFSMASSSQVSMFPSIPEHPGEYEELTGEYEAPRTQLWQM